MKKLFENYRIQAAGTIWEFEFVEMESDSEGKTLLKATEIQRINRSIANALCSEARPLTPDELEFLSKITRTRNTEIAARVYADPSTVTRWKEKKSIPALESEVLKEFFWNKLFSAELEKITKKKTQSSGAAALQRLGETAVENSWAGKPRRAA
jgi:formate dehydrogenase maturation protein FdhE